jgi:Uma2 family endonuclease
MPSTVSFPVPSAEAMPRFDTAADWLEALGGIPLDRVSFDPPPGAATESDVQRLYEQSHRLYELVDGTLVEKPMGFRESLLAAAVVAALRQFVIPRNLGLVCGEAGMMRLVPGLVRIPDAAYISWDRIPNRRVPEEPIPHLTPDLAVEILSSSNTPAEMARKSDEYFRSGCRLLWMIDPETRSATVYHPAGRVEHLQKTAILTGGDVLQGFSLPLDQVFAELDRRPD